MTPSSGGVFVTGGTGLLGLHWAQTCKAKEPVTLTVHRRSCGLSGVTAVMVDLSDEAALDGALQRSGARLVVHTAGLTSVEACEADQERARHENLTIATAVARAAQRNGCRLIHVSTDHVFSGKDDTYGEDAPVSPVNVYGRTKADAEVAVLAACPRALVVRTNFYGWGPPYRASFSDWIVNRLRQREPVPLFTDVRYTPTLIAPLIAAATRLSEQGVSGVLHLVGDEAISKFEFGRRLAGVFGFEDARLVPSRLVDQTGLVRRPASMALSTERLTGLLGRGLGSVDEHLRQLSMEASTALVREIRSL